MAASFDEVDQNLLSGGIAQLLTATRSARGASSEKPPPSQGRRLSQSPQWLFL